MRAERDSGKHGLVRYLGCRTGGGISPLLSDNGEEELHMTEGLGRWRQGNHRLAASCCPCNLAYEDTGCEGQWWGSAQ